MKTHAELVKLAEGVAEAVRYQMDEMYTKLYDLADEIEEMEETNETLEKAKDGLIYQLDEAFDTPFYDEVREILAEFEGEERVWRIRELIEGQVRKIKEGIE